MGSKACVKANSGCVAIVEVNIHLRVSKQDRDLYELGTNASNAIASVNKWSRL